MKVSKQDFDKFRQEIEQALNLVCNKYNMKVSAGNISYEQFNGEVSSIDLKLSFKSKENSYKAAAKKLSDYIKYGHPNLEGIKIGDWIWITVKNKQEMGTLIDLNTNSRKYPLILQLGDSNQTVSVNPEYFLELLNKRRDED